MSAPDTAPTWNECTENSRPRWCLGCGDWSLDADGHCLDCGCGDPSCDVEGCAGAGSNGATL